MRLAKTIGLVAAAVPVCHFVAATELDPDNAVALLSCAPRTLRALRWAITAGWDYHTNLHGSGPVDWKGVNATWAEALTSLCRRNGGVYVKAAQMLSTFGAMPEEYRTCLGQLHDRCAPKPFGRIHKSFRNELGEGYEQLFSEIQETAHAAASIAQVHCARLSTGQKVAIKVQYPGLKKAVTADLAILKVLTWVSDFVFPHFKVRWMIERLQDQISEEMDFTIEAKNAQNLEARMQHRPDIRVPQMCMELCTSRLLVMEWIDGCKLSDQHCLRSNGFNPRSIALTLIDVFSEMTLVNGYIHADPHPGNLLVIPTPYLLPCQLCSMICDFSPHLRPRWLRRLVTFQWRTPFQLVLLDHGRYLTMDCATRLDYCELWCHLVCRDQSHAIQTATRICDDESGGRLLPKVLYRPFDRRMRQHLRADNSLQDLMSILQSAPQTVVDALRILAVVRHVAAALADVRADRVYIEGSHAWDGLMQEEPRSSAHSLSWIVGIRFKIRLWLLRFAVLLRDASYSWTLFRSLT